MKMRAYNSYSKEFKEALVAKILSRGNRTIAEVCEAEGISKVTASNWVRRCGITPEMKNTTTVKGWNAEEKLKALIDTRGLAEEELGIYLRKEGLHSHRIDEWLADVLVSLQSGKKSLAKKDGRDFRIKELEKELLRKDKALAEASALLILKKKAELIWGIKEDEN